MEKMRQWTILSVVGVVAVFAAGWFLLVSPQHSHAATLHQQAASQQTANASLQSQVSQLQQQQKGLPAQQRVLDKIAEEVPDNPALPQLIRQLTTAADKAGVDLVALSPTAPTAMAAAAPASVTSTSTSTSSSTSTSTSSSSSSTGGVTAAAPAAPAPPALNRIDVAITVQGGYFNIQNFFQTIERLKRAMMVPQWTLSQCLPDKGTGSPTGGAATSSCGDGKNPLPGDLQAVITGTVFESPAAVPAAAPVTAAAPAPVQ